MAVKLNNKMRALLLLATLAMASATPQTVSFHILSGFGAWIRREKRNDAVARGLDLKEGSHSRRRFHWTVQIAVRREKKLFCLLFFFSFFQSARHVPRRQAQPLFASCAPT